jgi:hypothetical protein
MDSKQLERVVDRTPFPLRCSHLQVRNFLRTSVLLYTILAFSLVRGVWGSGYGDQLSKTEIEHQRVG